MFLQHSNNHLLKMADSKQLKRLNINNNIDQRRAVLEDNETTSPGHIGMFLNTVLLLLANKTQYILVSGVKVNLSSATDAVESSALGYQYSYVDVYSNSWGPSDFGFTVSKPGPLATSTLRSGVTRVCSN